MTQHLTSHWDFERPLHAPTIFKCLNICFQPMQYRNIQFQNYHRMLANMPDNFLGSGFTSPFNYLKVIVQTYPCTSLVSISGESFISIFLCLTLVCLPSGENNSCCSCENGYAWPSAVCSDLIICPSVSLALDLPCSYMMEMPFYGPYCEPQTEEPIVMNMSVRLDRDFVDDLGNSSSEFYKKYKADLEKKTTNMQGYLILVLLSFLYLFRSGSVFVNYEVKAGAASFTQIANAHKIVPQFLDAFYQVNQSTFTTEITNQTNFTVSPVDIFEGDTVRLICEVNSTSENVTWYHLDQIISPSSYRCTFTMSKHLTTWIYTATKIITVSSLYITPNLNDINVTCNSPEMQTNSPLLSCCIDRHLPSLTGDWKVNGAINITGVPSFSENCTEYKLNINESLCPPEKSGTVTTYTCKLQTGHGARRSRNINVTYLRTGGPCDIFSEGHSFNLTCESDVSNYDSISWKIQSGNKTKTVDCGTCIKNSKFPATSVLTVKSATQDWNGTYICTFSQKHLESSANVTLKVISLPLKSNILIDPITASIQCKVQQTLECCISANSTEDYNVTFVVQQNELQVGSNRFDGGKFFISLLLCFVPLCLFLNTAKEVSCSTSFGIGKEGATLIKPCRGLNISDGFIRGNVIYKCSNKSWKIARNDCLSESINNLLTSAESLAKSPEAKANLPTYLEELKKKTRMEQNSISHSPANLGAIVTILTMVSSIPADAKELTIQVSFILTWEDLNKAKKPASSLLLDSVENFTRHLQPVNNTIPPVSANSLQLQGRVVTENNYTDYNKSFSSTENLTVNVFIDESEIQTLTQNSTIVSVMYSKLAHILPRNEPECVNGLLITTTVSSNRSQKFNINMTFAKKDSSLKMAQCVFWNFTLNKERGGWDTRGCIATEVEDYVICSCSHLTPFSILMSPDKSSRVIFEDYITYIGLVISILSLVVCIIIESLVWKYVTNNTTSYMRHVCILNIATSLLIADIWFIVTASINDKNQQMSRGICFVATFFIHLFYLCVFFWMLSLGLILFYRLIFILHNTSKTAQKAVAFCLGYGCPFVIAVITIAVTLPRNNYTRRDVCWLNWKDSKALLAFVIPALIIVAINLFITAVVIIKILRPTIGDRSNRQEKNSLFQIGKSVAILTPLLGLTWGFGLATIIKNSHRAFHILFALFNALQVSDIYVWFCFFYDHLTCSDILAVLCLEGNKNSLGELWFALHIPVPQGLFGKPIPGIQQYFVFSAALTNVPYR
uniref:Adhesion G protein-coupled receptor F5 n=1 Tax=Strix occidentalis caurina TaxID=311401 RepID=A0A8D0FML0_STROC